MNMTIGERLSCKRGEARLIIQLEATSNNIVFLFIDSNLIYSKTSSAQSIVYSIYVVSFAELLITMHLL